MAAAKKQIKLGMFLRPSGHHVAAWRHPDAAEDSDSNFQHLIDVARTAERGLFDLIFIADNVAMPHEDLETLTRVADVTRIDPFTVMAALAMVTKRIGLVVTGTTTYDEPYFVARKFASLDLVSGGRSGWNVVTSGVQMEAANFGRDFHPSKSDRYQRAREFVDVVRGLWDTWDEGALVRDKASGIFFDPSKVHVLNHRGEHFKVRGPLNTSPSPQGHPVIVESGSSEDGRDLAAETAEVVFTAQSTLAAAQEFYGDLHRRMAKYGRDPDSLKVMPGMLVTVGRTEQEAQDKHETLQALIHPSQGLTLLSKYMGYDLSGCDIDAPPPEVPANKLGLISSRSVQLTEMARRENLTVRQLYERVAGGRGHFSVVGTAAQVVDHMEEWVTTGASDGFNVMAPYLPGGLDDFVELVIPELQRRGLFRTAYEGRTLRDHLGLQKPVSRYAKAAAAVAAE